MNVRPTRRCRPDYIDFKQTALIAQDQRPKYTIINNINIQNVINQ